MSRDPKIQQPSGNPYAFVPEDERENAGISAVASVQRTVVSKVIGESMAAGLERLPSGNPYARISQTDEDEVSHTASLGNSAGNTLSKAGFETECRRIFKQYMPAMERSGPLRGHYRNFIARNQPSSPARRHRLVKHLQKYDLSQVQGLDGRFNRETEPLTDEKLQQIERLVDNED